MSVLTVPGKVLLMGEYSVIEGGRALYAAVKPGLQYSLEEGDELNPHPESPLGVFQNEMDQRIGLKRVSKSSGLGLGSSTADLIAGATFLLGRASETETLWSWHRKHFPKASGGDLAVQNEAMRTDHGFYSIENRKEIAALESTPLFAQIFLFQTSASHKQPTHVDLEKPRAAFDLVKANALVEKFEMGIQNKDEKSLAVLSVWADWLHTLGLETDFAHLVRSAFTSVPHVLGVKGCGAGLNDVFMVAVAKEGMSEKENSDFTRIASENSLHYLGNLQELLWKK